jgi:YVTN family beta-propeller protein
MSIRHAASLLVLLLASFSHAGSSNSLLDLSPDGKRLLAVNADNGTVTVVDTTEKKKLTEIKVGEKPECATWIGAGPLAAVTVYRESKVVFIDTAEGKVVETLKVSAEPYGIVATKDGSKAYVTHEYPGLVSEIDLQTRKVLRTLKAGDMVRGIALSPDEKKVYVTEFYTANLHCLDLASGKVVDTWKGQATDNLARQVVIHPTRPKAYVTHIRSKVTVNDGRGSIFPHLTIYDLVPPEKGNRRSSIGLDTYNSVYVVTNPWESAISPDLKRFYTVYAATDDMNVSAVVDDDYKEIERINVRTVGKNPRAVRVSPDSSTVYVYAALDFEVVVMDANLNPKGRIKVCDPPKSPEWVRGKYLFGTATYPMSAPRWVACSSCHPDGHSDGRVWQQPEGLRKVPPLFGLAHTHPLHWSADRDEVQDFEYTIQSKLMQGPGFLRGKIKPKEPFKPTELDEKTSGRSADLDAIAIYTNSFEFTFLSPHAAGPGKLTEAAERGKKLFTSDAVGCAKCHSGPYYTDSSLAAKPFNVHDVGTGNDDPTEKIGPKYDTPTLLGVYRSAPYLHHGKAKTLHEVLTTYNKGDRHGKTSHLKKDEIDDLVEFLKSLPYEHPPMETPNTVKYRLQPKKE